MPRSQAALIRLDDDGRVEFRAAQRAPGTRAWVVGRVRAVREVALALGSANPAHQLLWRPVHFGWVEVGPGVVLALAPSELQVHLLQAPEHPEQGDRDVLVGLECGRVARVEYRVRHARSSVHLGTLVRVIFCEVYPYFCEAAKPKVVARGGRGGWRHEHSVDDVHDTVRCVVVGGGHLGAVDEDAVARDTGGHVLALHRRDHLLVIQVLGVHVPSGHVVGEDVDELRLVLRLEEVGEDAGGELGEGLVGRGKDGEGALARERVHEVSCLERGDQGGEIGRRDGEIHDGIRAGGG